MNLFELPDLNEQAGLPQEEAPKRALLERVENHTFALRIDNSTLETFQTCSKAAKFYCVDRRQRVPSGALAFGSAFHIALDHIYRGGYGQADLGIAKAMEYLSANSSPNPDEWRTPALLQDSIQAYVKEYSKDDAIVPLRLEGKPMVEIPFSLVLGEIPLDQTLPFKTSELTDEADDSPLYIDKLIILWSGRIDIAGNYGDNDVYVIDHKTTSIGGPQFFADFYLSQQMVGYNWALRNILPTHKIVGTVVNAIIQRKPTRTGKGLEFSRQTYFHQDWHVSEWESDVMSEVSRFVYSLCENSFPKATKWCFGKYGRCPYHEVCTLPPAQRKFMLDSREYINVTWSPLNTNDET
jgi:hypothetical protein